MASAITVCQQRGVLNDVACARLWADHWARAGWAWPAIHEKLSAKGLAEAAIAAARHDIGAGPQEELMRARAVRDNLRQRRPVASDSAVARRLASRGFDEDVIERLFNERNAER